jgi:predicted DNA-binding WGR domain protein
LRSNTSKSLVGNTGPESPRGLWHLCAGLQGGKPSGIKGMEGGADRRVVAAEPLADQAGGQRVTASEQEGGKHVRTQQHPEDIPIEVLAQFGHYLRFVSYDPAQNRARFYLLSWQPALDGRATLVCTWGRIGTCGRSRVVGTADQLNTQAMIARLIKRRLQRGYHVLEWR